MSNPKPTKLSTMEEISDMRKGCVNKILDDDYGAGDVVSVAYKVKGDSSEGENFMKLNGSLKMSSPDDDIEFKWTDNVEMRTVLSGYSMKGKIKNGRFLEHYDLGVKDWTVNLRGKEETMWFNPYFRWGASTSLTNIAFSVGLASYLCKHVDSRNQINYNPLDNTDGNSAWSMCSRNRFTKGNFWLDSVKGFNFAKIKETQIKHLRLGWSKDNLSLILQGNNIRPFLGGNPIKDSLSLGAVWKHASIGAMVARFKHFMNGKPLAFEFGMLRRVNDKVTVKGKVDQDWNLNVFGSLKCCDSITSELSVMTNLLNSGKVTGLMDLPFKVGLKVKVNK